MATIYKGNDNPIKLILRQGSTPFDLSNYTKMELIVDDSTTFDSITNSAYFEVDTSRTGLLILRIGMSGIDVGTYEPELIYYDTNNVNGISFGSFSLIVK